MSAKGRTGTLTRTWIGLQVGLTTLLALAAVLLVNYLAGRPGIRQRIDLTEKNLNTLSTATRGVLRRVEAPVQIDVFFRPEEGPISRVAGEVMERTFRLLVLFAREADSIEGGTDLEIVTHDLRDPVAVQARLDELRLRGFENCLVVSNGERREVLRLVGDLAEFDPGRPKEMGFVPASIVSFDAEAAIVQAVLKVSDGAVPKVYFTNGHGERDLYDLDDKTQLGELHTNLVQDGFDAAWWQFDEDGPVPDDCAALAIIGPTAPFSEPEFEAVTRYVEGGGRLVIASPNSPEDLERSSVPELLDHYGMSISSGIVAQPYVDAGGNVTYGDPRNVAFRVLPDQMLPHAITDPLRQGGRSIVLSFVHQLRLVRQPERGGGRPFLRSIPLTWLDQAPNDFQPDAETEAEGPFDIGIVMTLPAGDGTVGPLEQKREGRLVVVGSADAFCSQWADNNADFLRNTFNWAASRDYRVSISPRDPDQRRLPLGESDVVARVLQIVRWGVPALCLVLGLVTAFVRRSRGPRKVA